MRHLLDEAGLIEFHQHDCRFDQIRFVKRQLLGLARDVIPARVFERADRRGLTEHVQHLIARLLPGLD